MNEEWRRFRVVEEEGIRTSQELNQALKPMRECESHLPPGPSPDCRQTVRGERGVNRRTGDWTAGHIFSDGASSTSTARFHRCYGESYAGWAYQ